MIKEFCKIGHGLGGDCVNIVTWVGKEKEDWNGRYNPVSSAHSGHACLITSIETLTCSEVKKFLFS
jgi:hypothetical protein